MAESVGLQNRAKTWQIVLFPFNNAATNCYLTLMTFISYFAGYYISGNFLVGAAVATVSAAFTVVISTLVMVMRIFDGVTDPVCGALMDKTNGKLGKFRIFMIAGNLIMAVSMIFMFFIIRPVEQLWLRWTLFVFFYITYVIGYTCQCACTKAGQTCLTSDPKQRSSFVIWNMLGMIMSIVLVNLLGNGILPTIVPKVNETLGAQYNPVFYNILVPIVIILSIIYTLMALAAIWNKDRPEYWGVGETGKKTKFKDYVSLIKHNKPIKWLVLSSGFNKLASTIATSGAVAILLYEIMMGDYNGLYMPIYALSFVFMGLFFMLGSKTAGKKGQKRAVAMYTAVAFLFYIALVAMLLIWSPGDPNTKLSLFYFDDAGKFHISVNAFTIIWIIMYGCGYGAYNCCSEMCIPMVADCTDYETYRSGQYVPGIMGTIFSLIDKVVSSAAVLFTTIFTVYLIPGLNGALPSTGVDLKPIVDSGYQGVKLSALICVCFLPMISWLVTMFSMTKYDLSGEKLKEIQAVNAVRKAAISEGMSLEEAMETWKTIDQVPARFVNNSDSTDKHKSNVFTKMIDKIYDVVWGKHDHIDTIPSSNPIELPSVRDSETNILSE